MAKIIEKLFGSEKTADEFQQLHEELRVAIENLRKLEEDWHEKVRIVQEFLRNWNGKWDLNKLTQRIRILKKIEKKEYESIDAFKQTVLHIEHIMDNNKIHEDIRLKVREIFSKEQETWNNLKSTIQWQLSFIEYTTTRDIGVFRFEIKSIINSLKKEAQLLGLEKREVDSIIKVEKSFESKIRGGVIRKLSYNRRLERLYELGFPKYHFTELANFMVYEWAKTEKIITASGKHTEYVLGKGIPSFLRFLSRDNLLDIGIAVAKLVNSYREEETEKIVLRITRYPYIVNRTDIYGELADIIVAARENHAYVIESLVSMREKITKENIVSIGNNLIKIAQISGENAEPVLATGFIAFNFLINEDNVLDVGLCLAEVVKNAQS